MLDPYLMMADKADQVKLIDKVREKVLTSWPAGTYFEVRQGVAFVDGDGCLAIEVGAFQVPEGETYPPCLADFGRIYLAAFLPDKGYYIISREKVPDGTKSDLP